MTHLNYSLSALLERPTKVEALETNAGIRPGSRVQYGPHKNISGGTEGPIVGTVTHVTYVLGYDMPGYYRLEVDCDANPENVKRLEAAERNFHLADAAPGFEQIHGRKPIAGEDYSADGDLCQDDYEYLTGTGRYS